MNCLAYQFWLGAHLGTTTVAKTLAPGFGLAATVQLIDFPITFRYSGTADKGLGIFDFPTESLSERSILIGYRLKNISPKIHQMVALGVSQIDGRHRSSRNDEPISGGWMEFTTYDYEYYTATGFTAEYSVKKVLLPTIAVGMGVGGNFSKEISYYNASVSLNVGYFKTD